VIEVGAKIAGKYRVEQILGRGGMGYVVQAFHEHLAESVAIKFMVPELAIAPDASIRFLREARAAFRIKSEHVARVLDVGEHGGSPFIVMELLSGRDLATEIAARYVPSHEAVGYVLQVCEALAAAHALGIVHRDLKPSNLFLTRNRDGKPLIKVLDFGISKAMDDPNAAPADSLTASHRLLGSPHYMSPEQALAPKSADARSDIWSLGVVLYELVLCERPFRGNTPVEILASLLSARVPELSAAQRRRMPDALMQVILRCLDREPELRFANVGELARTLLPLATPNPEQVVGRIEGRPRAVPVNTSATESLPNLRHSLGSTLLSGRSSLIGTTANTHSVDTRVPPTSRPSLGLKVLALAAVLAVPLLWFVTRGVRAHDEADPAAQRATTKRDEPSRTENRNERPQQSPTPTAPLEVALRASLPDRKPSPSASPTISAAPVPSVTAHPDRKPGSPGQAGRSSSPIPSTGSQPSTGTFKTNGVPPRPVSTADPKNQPE
jgi:serine/threonine protein kinase